MKLALVMKDYDISRGGAERQLVQTASCMAERGVSVDIIANSFKTKPANNIGARRVNALMWSSIFKQLSFNLGVHKLLRNSDYDIVYGLTQIYPQDVYRVGGGLVRNWLEIKYPNKLLRILNSISPRMAIRLFMENQIFKYSNYKKIITNSLFCKYQILQHYKVSPSDIVVVYNGVDKKRFTPEVKSLYKNRIRDNLNIPKDHKVILFVSNNWARKGLKELLQAFSFLANKKPVWLVVVGKGKKNSYIKLAKKLKVSKKVIFIGQTKEPQQYYGACDLLVLPTYYDPFSNVVLEALACGVPAITTRANGARELIKEGQNGYLIDTYKDIEKMAKYIEKVFFQDDIELMKKEAVLSTKEFTIENNVDKCLEIFRDILEGKKKHIARKDDILTTDGYGKFFEDKEWTSVSQVMKIKGGKLYKKNNLRSVVEIQNNGKNIFLKRHFKITRPSWAIKEWQNIYTLKSLGFNTMHPVAVGENGKNGSFVFTKALENAERLEDFIPKYFNSTLNKKKILEKKQLVNDLAELTKRLHGYNLFHKDYYAGHIFVRKDQDAFQLYLIDLQRLCNHAIFKKRWCIKDLASLNYSCFNLKISNADRLRFFKTYLGVKAFGSRDRQLIKKIIYKTEKIIRHTNKKMLKKKHT